MKIKAAILIIVFLLCLNIADALTAEDKGKIEEGLKRYGNDSVKMGLFINTLNVGEDLSNEDKLREEIVNKANALQIDKSAYSNIELGKTPESVLNAREQNIGAEEKGIEAIKTEKKSEFSWSLIGLLLGIIIVFVLLGWWYGKKK